MVPAPPAAATVFAVAIVVVIVAAAAGMNTPVLQAESSSFSRAAAAEAAAVRRKGVCCPPAGVGCFARCTGWLSIPDAAARDPVPAAPAPPPASEGGEVSADDQEAPAGFPAWSVRAAAETAAAMCACFASSLRASSQLPVTKAWKRFSGRAGYRAACVRG